MSLPHYMPRTQERSIVGSQSPATWPYSVGLLFPLAVALFVELRKQDNEEKNVAVVQQQGVQTRPTHTRQSKVRCSGRDATSISKVIYGPQNSTPRDIPNYELHQLHSGEVFLPPRPNIEAGEEVVKVPRQNFRCVHTLCAWSLTSQCG